MQLNEKLNNLLKMAALVVGLVVLQQLIGRVLFGLQPDFAIVPQLTLTNLGLVCAWLYLERFGKIILMFVALIVPFCSALWLLAIVIILLLFLPKLREFLKPRLFYR